MHRFQWYFRKPYRGAAQEAFMWPEKATAIVAAGRSLQELTGIGLSLTKRLHGWIVARDLRSARLFGVV
jgi:hypothetical protein